MDINLFINERSLHGQYEAHSFKTAIETLNALFTTIQKVNQTSNLKPVSRHKLVLEIRCHTKTKFGGEYKFLVTTYTTTMAEKYTTGFENKKLARETISR